MKVEITQKVVRILLGAIVFGGFFWWEGKLYLKICPNSNDKYWCFNVRMGALETFDDDTMVIPEKRKLKISLDEGE